MSIPPPPGQQPQNPQYGGQGPSGPPQGPPGGPMGAPQGPPAGGPGQYPGAGGSVPQTPQKKNRTPLFIGLACLLLAVVVGGIGLIGGGVLLFAGGDEEPSPSPSEETTTTEPPSEPPSSEPPSSEPPSSEPPSSEPPSSEPPETKGAGPGMVAISEDGNASIKVQELLPERDTLPTSDGDVKPLDGKFVGVGLTVYNDSDDPISLTLDNFTVTTSDDKELAPRYGRTTTEENEIAPGETEGVELYVEAPEGTTVIAVAYSDPSVDGGDPIIADSPTD